MVDKICDNCMSRVPADAEKCPRCGVRFENTNPGGALPNGWVLGKRYTIGRYLDIDGEGVSYSAIDGDTLQRVIVKEFMPVTLCATRDEYGVIVPKPGCEVLFKTTRIDFSELYGVLLRMGLTEGLVQVLDVLEENNTAYAVIEKVDGPTLAEYLARRGEAFEINRALAMLQPIMLGVDAMHTANLVHRGIAPENIILESGGNARLSGYATLALRQQGSELKAKLYPGYSAPEQYAASEFEGTYTDIYALGALLYRMTTGEVPTAANERRIQDDLRAPRTVNREVPAYISHGIMHAMRLTPAERFQSVPDIRLALSGSGGKTARGPLGLTKQQLIIGGAALGVVVLALIILLLVSIFGGGKKPASSSSSSITSTSSVASSSSVALGNVPDFSNRVYKDVINSQNYSHYVFAPATEEYSDTVQPGYIISQTPTAGTPATDGMTIQLVVSKGPEMVEVPDVTNLSRGDAVARLQEAGITNYTVMDRANPDGQYTPGRVVETSPAAGQSVRKSDGSVTLYIATEKPKTVVPSNLVGMSQANATDVLYRAGIRYSIEMVDNDMTMTPGNVVRVSPAPGTEINPDTDFVTLYVAKDKTMPNYQSYVGQPVSNLTAELQRVGIPYDAPADTETNDPAKDGTIARIDQSPAPGSALGASPKVTIHVYHYVVPPAAST